MDCELKSCNCKPDYWNKRFCELFGHIFCKCEECKYWSVCTRCSLSIKSGNYLA